MKTVKKVLHYLKKYIPLMVMSLILAVGIVAFTLYVPILIGQAIDCIVYGNINFDAIMQILMQVIMIVLLTALFQWLMNVINNKVTYQVVRDIRNEAFEKLQRLPLKYLDAHPYGETVSRIISDVEQFADGLLMGFTQFFTGIMTILGTLVFMLMIHKGITVLVVLVTPLSLFVANFIAKHTYSMFMEQSKTRGEQTSLIDEMVGNEKVVKAFAQEDEAVERFEGGGVRILSMSQSGDDFHTILRKCSWMLLLQRM